MSARGGTPYVGSKISLISKAQIRYEGILSSVDTDNSTVALAKVKSYGTEDRHTDIPVPPKEEIYEYIVFRGRDIKDITVSEPMKPFHGFPRDPFLLSSLGCSSGCHPCWNPYRNVVPTYNQLATGSLLTQEYNSALGLGFHGILARKAPMVEQAVQTVPLASSAQKRKTSIQPQQVRQTTRSPQRAVSQVQKENFPRTQTVSEPNGGGAQGQSTSNKKRQKRGSHLSKNLSRGQHPVKNPKPTTLKFESDFDFETANAQFEGLSEVLVQKDPKSLCTQETPGDKNYDMNKGFFDNLSSDIKPRTITWDEVKKLNLETFGMQGPLVRGRRFWGRGRRGQSKAEQRPVPKIASGRV
ncbi:protein LSM14 homolog B-like isoform X2 [Syngnathoides biaculeatus]|uniref:protein LSM14 homolog B-like isoform X2 n=1 Tax=Syngnathoides biaculeatus TaxID=300417 RepID=UPI002ADDCAD6|nr:protein LSM14 homolog B-like isoform X2 [Syngnathoides biaculeatus]